MLGIVRFPAMGYPIPVHYVMCFVFAKGDVGLEMWRFRTWGTLSMHIV